MAGAVGTRVASRPPHRPVLAAFPHTVPTSGTDNQALRLDVCSPALALALRQPRVPGPESGSWRAGPHSPRPLSFAPPTPPQIPFPGPLCSPVSLATMTGLDFPRPCIIGYGSSPSRCGPSLSRDADGQRRDLPASDAIRLHVMWPLTPTGRRHLAFVEERCRTCCLRASKNSRPLRCLTFRGSIPHPMQQLCTLRVRLCCRLTQHSLPGGPLRPYPGRTCTG